MNLDFNDFLGADDIKLDFKMEDFDFDGIEKIDNRYIKPKLTKLETKIHYKNAKELALNVKLFPREQLHYIVQGNFIFGDFIEALLVEKNVICNEMYVSTLSMSQNNVDSLAGLIENDYIKNKLNLMISNYFYSHEKNKLIPYVLKKCDIDNKFDLLVMRNHTKICLMQISNIFLVLSGSANLRSSNSVEQFVLQENKELYNFYKKWFDNNQKYSIINKGIKK